MSLVLKSPLFLLLGCLEIQEPPPLGLGWPCPQRSREGQRTLCTQSSCDQGQLGRGSWKRQGESSLLHPQSYVNASPKIRGCQFYPGWGDSWLSFDLPGPSPGWDASDPPGATGLSGYQEREGDGEAIASVFGLGFSSEGTAL